MRPYALRSVVLRQGSGLQIGGYVVGTPVRVTSGQSYTVAAGDNFEGPLDILSPANPFGKYATTRCYMSGSAGNGPRSAATGTALVVYDADPFHTGNNDANRGNAVASWADSMIQVGGKLKLKARVSSSAEQALSVDPSMPTMGSMINTTQNLLLMVPFYLESNYARVRQPGHTDTGGWHPSFWFEQVNAIHTYTGTEIDFEGTNTNEGQNYVSWQGASQPFAFAGTNVNDPYDNSYHTRGLEILIDGTINYYVDRVLKSTHKPSRAIDITRPYFAMFCNHVANFGGDPFSLTNWTAAGSDGAQLHVDYLMAAHGGGGNIVPAVAPITINVAFGAAFSMVLPTTSALWGSNFTEVLEGQAQEVNEPSGNNNGGYSPLPTGVSYNAGTFTLSGTITDKSGRSSLIRYPTVQGTVIAPHRIVINVGPHLSVTSLPNAVTGSAYSYDLYAVADCGVLTSNASGVRAKTIAVTGLPSGLTYTDSTGLITGTPSADFSVTLAVTITNSIGQTVTSNSAFVGATAIVPGTGAAAPTLTGTATLTNSIDFDKTSLLSLTADTPPYITSAAPADSTGVTISNTGTNRPTQSLRANSRYAAKFTSASVQSLQGAGTFAAGGTMVVIFEPITTGSQVIAEVGAAGSNTTRNRQQLIGLSGTGLSARKCGTATGPIDAVTTNAVYTVALHIAVLTFDTIVTAPALYYDGTSTPITGALTGNAAGMDTLTIGCRHSTAGNDLPFNGYVYRVLTYSNTLNVTQIEQIATWAVANYRTPNLT